MDINFLGELNEYINQNYIARNHYEKYDGISYYCTPGAAHELSTQSSDEGETYSKAIRKYKASSSFTIPDVDKEYDSFAQTLFKFIDSKGISDGDACRFSGIDRRVLSKIRNSDNYTPTKKTIFSFAIGLKLSEEETIELLMKAGYAFSNTSKADLIIRYFIHNRIYNIWEINEALDYYGQPPIGC